MDDPLREAEGRLQRYWNVDGLHELGIAVLLGLTALWTWASDLSDLPRAWKGSFSATFPILLMGGIFAEGHVVKAIRRRLTYPRAGFVEFRKPSRSKHLRAALLGALAAGLCAAAIRAKFDMRLLTAAIGIGMGAMMWQIGSRSELPRFQAIGGFAAALGVALAGTGWTFEVALVVYFGAAAAALFISGGITLWRFLHA